MVGAFVNGLVSVAVGIGLWLFLPRGVVLIRIWPVRDWQDNVLPDTWGLRNDSALPMRIRSVAYLQASEGSAWGEMPPEGTNGVDLNLDDETDEVRRTDRRPMIPWSKIVIQPGDTMKAQISVNSALRIKYRRAGWAGVLERREITIHGFV